MSHLPRYKHRSSMIRLAERAAKKCTQFYVNGLHFRGPMSEYVALCYHFGVAPDTFSEHYVRMGCANVSTHYIKVPEKVAMYFQKSQYNLVDKGVIMQ